MGYHRSGWDVTGVDIQPQPHYPFRFIQGDALDPPVHLADYDAIHASPPCQGYSVMRNLPWLKGRRYPLLIPQVRQMLADSERPWIIEGVPGSPLRGVELCALSFGLNLFRHRWFECNVLLFGPHHVRHPAATAGRRLNRKIHRGLPVLAAGHQYGKAAISVAMGIDWMTRDELCQAIPPAYTTYLGAQLLRAVRR